MTRSNLVSLAFATIFLSACVLGGGPANAAAPVRPAMSIPAALYAPSMSTKSGGEPVDSHTYVFWSNGAVSELFQFPTSGTYTFTINARADLASGVGANMVLRIDDKVVASTIAGSASPTDYIFPALPVTQGAHRVAVAFTNDLYDPARGFDRNLYVGHVSIAASAANPSPPPPTSSSVAISADDDTYQSNTAFWAHNDTWGRSNLRNGID